MTVRKRLKENAANRREGAEHISIGYVPEISISVYFLARWSFLFSIRMSEILDFMRIDPLSLSEPQTPILLFKRLSS